ncbi:MAG: carbamoyltransferase HypF [bacterium]
MKVRKKIKISGVLGCNSFLSYLEGLAKKFNLSGCVENKPLDNKVSLEIEGNSASVFRFISVINGETDGAARLTDINFSDIPVQNCNDFKVFNKKDKFNKIEDLLKDIATCPDCESKIMDKNSPFYNYPFMSCEKCGPKYSKTTLLHDKKIRDNEDFYEFCTNCKSSENNNDEAEICLKCSNKVWLKTKDNLYFDVETCFSKSSEILLNGGIILFKSTNTFYLCSSTDSIEAIKTIKEIKTRKNKPLHIMARSIEEIEKFAILSEQERKLLLSPERPVVMLELKDKKYFSDEIIIGFSKVGVMLPFNPIQLLLFKNKNLKTIVLSNANNTGRNVETDNLKAEEQFGKFVDAMLFHDKNIVNGSDDSIVKVINGKKYFIRVARGYAPMRTKIENIEHSPVILACGAHQSSTLTIVTPDGHAHVSPYMGNLDTANVFDLYKKNVSMYCNLFNINPDYAVCDLNNDYLSTKYIKTLKIPFIQMQHHFAHLISCIADNELPVNTPAIGVIMDGTGFGEDQTSWGGELLVYDGSQYKREQNIPVFKMIGISGKENEIYRLGYSLLKRFSINSDYINSNCLKITTEEIKIFDSLLNKGVSSPLTSSATKLFDGVASIMGVLRYSYYQEFSSLYLENIANKQDKSYYKLNDYTIKNISSLIQAIVKDIENKVDNSLIAARLHNTFAKMIAGSVVNISKNTGIKTIALSGALWMNGLLLERTIEELEKHKLDILTHKNTAPNDEGISLGQAAYMSYMLSGEAYSSCLSDNRLLLSCVN